MFDTQKILAAYYRAIVRHERASGVSYPRVRESCVLDNGTVVDTSVYDSDVVAKWRESAGGRVTISLV